MKEVTEIKVGQVWLLKGQTYEPVMVNEANQWVEYRWFENGEECFDNCISNHFIHHFDFVADSMSEEDFKEWCKTGENPTLKKETKDDEIIYQSAPVAHDPINHPSHYTSDPSGVECIEITRHRNFNIGNAIKYLWRAGLKDGNSDIQDLQKAAWYINDEIKRLKQNGSGL